MIRCMRSGWACPVRSGTTEHPVHAPRSAWPDCRTLCRYRFESLWAGLWCWRVAPGFAPVGFHPVPALARWLRSCHQTYCVRGNSWLLRSHAACTTRLPARPASASRKKPMICSSVNRFFTSNLLSMGLDSKLRRYSNPGGRRDKAKWWYRAATIKYLAEGISQRFLILVCSSPFPGIHAVLHQVRRTALVDGSKRLDF